MTVPFAIRVRRGDREVEVHGSEEFVREMLDELLEEHLRPAPRPLAGAPSVAGVEEQTFRELLNAAPNATAAERCVIAAHVLFARGQQSFGRDEVVQLFEEAMERQPNFYREVPNAVRSGWLTRAQGEADGKRFRLTASGVARVRELVGAQEAE